VSELLNHLLKEPKKVQEIQNKLRHPSTLSSLYEAWRKGILTVQRTWGNTDSPSQTVIYKLDSCLLPDDILQINDTTSEKGKDFTVVTWNINSIRSRLDLLLDWLAEKQPDLVALQETKVEDVHFPIFDLQQAGYYSVFSGQKSYNGVAFLSKEVPDQIRTGFRNGFDPENCRLISVLLKGIWFINVYLPQGQSIASEKFAYKLEFLEQLTAEISEYPTETMIVLGDLNIAPEEIDVPDPTAMKDMISFRPEERAAFKHLLALGLHDVFRKFNNEPGHYSWWDYRTRGFERNDGMRIDHVLSSRRLLEQATQSYIDLENRSQAKPSDHAPVFSCFAIGE
jgi:exodeoxyribonuclease-3